MKIDNIYNVLNEYLKRSNKNSTNEVICRFMLNHLLEIPYMSVNEIAGACFTSHPSIIRFTRELGFEGISDFKYNVENYIDQIRNKEMRVNFPVDILSDDEKYAASLNTWMQNQCSVITETLLKIDKNKVKKLCEEIDSHKKILTVGGGLSDVILELFRIELARSGKIVNNIGSDLQAIETYGREDTLVIILSIHGRYLSEFFRQNGEIDQKKYLNTHANRSWLITMNKNLYHAPVDDMIIIDCKQQSFEFSLNVMISFFEIVGQCYQEMFG